MENAVKEYGLGNDFTGYRELIFKVSDATEVLDSDGKVVGNTDNYTDSDIETYSYKKSENKVNKEEDLNLDNYNKVKSIIEDRLSAYGTEDYNISLDKENGNIYLQIPENAATNHTVSNILQVSKFEIRDSKDASKVYLTNDDLKKAVAGYSNGTSGTAVYLQLGFKQEGAEKLKDLTSGEYKTVEKTEDENTTTNETTADGEANITSDESSEEEKEDEDEEEQKELVIAIDGTELITTSFDEPVEDGYISLTMGQASTDISTINNTLTSASTVSTGLNTGKMPLTYTISENRFVKTDLTQDIIIKCVIVIAVIMIIALLVLIFKYKLEGLIAVICYIGFVAIDLLLVRYTNVYITIESIVAGIILLGINYLLVLDLLRSEDRKALQIKTFATKLLPVFLIAVIFTFLRFEKMAEFGMFMFWGIFLSTIYNYLLTRNMLSEKGK